MLEKITFSHFSEVSWVGLPFMMSLTTMRAKVNSMAAVFIDPHSLAVRAYYEILQFHVVECTLLTLHSAVLLRGLTSYFLG